MAEIKTVLVCGAGTMGAGIAQTFAAAGFDVRMRDISPELVDRGFKVITGPLMKRVEKGKMTKDQVDSIVSKIRGVVDLKEACAGVDYVVEAVFEDMKVKKDVFRALDEFAPHHAILASNTSSLSISEMAASTKRPERVIGMHFFNPAPIMQLIEVVRGAQTSDETVASSKALAAKLGKVPVEVKESPGFVVNRLLVPMMNEAFNLLQEGVASADDIDKAMKMGTNMPMGPFELADYTGIDIGLHTMETLFHETGDPKFRPSPLLRKYVRAGRVGKKVGRGVYTYNEKGERIS
jgi:3-hydroxybutyryl-CoA dehydrogenase